MNITCDDKWSNQGELSVLKKCFKYIPLDNGLKLAEIALCSLIFLIQIVFDIIRYQEIKKKSKCPQIIICWSLVQPAIMVIRPTISYTLELHSYNSLVMSLVTNCSAASIAGIAVMFVYIQVKLLQHAAMSKTTSVTLPKNRKVVLLSIGLIQAILFITGSFVSNYGSVSGNLTFWIPVILVDFIVIPYFCYLGILIYNMVKVDNKSLARQIMLVVMICSGLALSTGTMAILGATQILFFDWILIELCWLAAILFGFVIIILVLKGGKQTIKIKTVSTAKTVSEMGN